jgi:serine/threonine-protein kinase
VPASITLLDFGAARVDTAAQGRGLTVAGTAVGTPTSMAPEQIVGFDPDARTDVYAAGCLLFRMLTGRYPFQDGTPDRVMLDHLSTTPPRPSELAAVSAELERVVLRCLEKRPEDRFQSARELDAALREVHIGKTPSRAGAVAIHIELHGDESVIDAHGLDAFALAADRLVDAGFELALGVGGSVLALRDVVGNPHDAVLAARELAARLSAELVRVVHPALDPVATACLQRDGEREGDGDDRLAGDAARSDRRAVR